MAHGKKVEREIIFNFIRQWSFGVNTDILLNIKTTIYETNNPPNWIVASNNWIGAK